MMLFSRLRAALLSLLRHSATMASEWRRHGPFIIHIGRVGCLEGIGTESRSLFVFLYSDPRVTSPLSFYDCMHINE
jgi:hypothetical protein